MNNRQAASNQAQKLAAAASMPSLDMPTMAADQPASTGPNTRKRLQSSEKGPSSAAILKLPDVPQPAPKFPKTSMTIPQQPKLPYILFLDDSLSSFTSAFLSYPWLRANNSLSSHGCTASVRSHLPRPNLKLLQRQKRVCGISVPKYAPRSRRRAVQLIMRSRMSL